VRSAAPRHQTLRASVEWSHALLTEPEKAVLRRLSVFAGSFDHAAARAVAAEGVVETHHVLDQLTSLIDKSLVMAEHDQGLVRYRLLETVRHFALEQLTAAGEDGAVRRRHRDHYLAVADAARTEVMGPRQDACLSVLEHDLENLRVAFEWSLGNDEPETALLLTVLLFGLWHIRGLYDEGRHWLDHALSGAEEVTPALRVPALAMHALFGAGRTSGEEAVKIARQIGDEALLGQALRSAALASAPFDLDGAVRDSAEGVELARRVGDSNALAIALQGLAVLLMDAGDAVGTLRAAEEGLALATEAQNPYVVRWCRTVLGRMLLWTGRPREGYDMLRDVIREASVGDRIALCTAQCVAAEAMALLEEPGDPRALSYPAVAVSREVGTDFHQAATAYGAGVVELILGDADAAREALQLCRSRIGESGGFGVSALAAQAEAELALGEIERAQRLAADAVECARDNGLSLYKSMTLRASARVSIAVGDVDAAERSARQALESATGVGDSVGAVDALDILAGLAVDFDPARAVRLFAAASATRHALGVVRYRISSHAYESAEQALRSSLDGEDFDKAWGEGAALSLDEAVAYLRRGRGERKRPSVGWASLTPSEIDVARLVAEGLTNKDIAAKLFISPRTVQAHLTHTYAKLGVTSRVELTRETLDRISQRTSSD